MVVVLTYNKKDENTSVQKQKCYVDWTAEKKSKNMFMETIQHMQS